MDDLRGKRILVSGAAGFIGANLVREFLRRGADVHAIVRPSTRLWRVAEILSNLTLHRVDLTSRQELVKTVNESQPEMIFHLAAPGVRKSQQDALEILRSNIIGTTNLLEATTSLKYERFVHIGSSTEYGKKNAPMNESDLLEPVTFHSATKAATTLLCQQFAKANRRPLVILRPFSVYGPWEDPAHLIPTAIMAAFRNQEIPLTVAGYKHDLVFVEDVVEACLLALEANEIDGEIINIGSGQQWANEEVVNTVQELSGRKIKIRVGAYPARPIDTNYWVADIRKAKALLGWEPRHNLRQGLDKMISWFHLHEDIYSVMT